MSAENKFENATEKLGGQAKEGFGKITGDKEIETEGKADQASASVKDKIEDAKDTVKGAVNKLTGSGS